MHDFPNASYLKLVPSASAKQTQRTHVLRSTYVNVLRSFSPALPTISIFAYDVGQIAQLADGFVTARQGGTVVMVSAVSNRAEMDDSGFLPLSVDYREKVRTQTKKSRP